MQFALPPRKTSAPPVYERVSAKSAADKRRKQLQTISYGVLSLLTVCLLYTWFSGTSTAGNDGAVSAKSSVLIVTILDEKTMSEDYINIIKANRDAYAAQHGYKTFYTNTSTYQHLFKPAPSSWSTVPALRHALTLYPEVDYLWSLSPHALITNTSLSLYSHIFSRLPALMLKDIPVVPPDSVIHTFSYLTTSQAYLILTQDIDNIAHTSFLLRNTQLIPVVDGRSPDTWTQFLLDAWFDPLYRAYSFQKAENHALEHIVQWHPTVLAKLVMIEQRFLNSYNYQPPKIVDVDTKLERVHDSMWQPGDLLVNFKGCTESNERDCESEMRQYYAQWVDQIRKDDASDVSIDLKVTDYVPRPSSKKTPEKTKTVPKKPKANPKPPSERRMNDPGSRKAVVEKDDAVKPDEEST